MRLLVLAWIFGLLGLAYLAVDLVHPLPRALLAETSLFAVAIILAALDMFATDLADPGFFEIVDLAWRRDPSGIEIAFGLAAVLLDLRSLVSDARVAAIVSAEELVRNVALSQPVDVNLRSRLQVEFLGSALIARGHESRALGAAADLLAGHAIDGLRHAACAHELRLSPDGVVPLAAWWARVRARHRVRETFAGARNEARRAALEAVPLDRAATPGTRADAARVEA
jgi:hypothetical protein